MNGAEPQKKSLTWLWVLLGCGGLAVVAVPVVAIVAAIAIPSLLSARRSSLETNAVVSLRTYATAQAMYQRSDPDGNGKADYADQLPKLANTTDSSGSPIRLIDPAFAAAHGASGVPKHGYIFREITTIGGRPIDWTNDFALSAIPVQYGRTGYRTFIINTSGTIFGRDQGPGGTFVDDYPANPSAAGWLIAE